MEEKLRGCPCKGGRHTLTLPLVRHARGALLVQADENPASPRALSAALCLLPPPGATYLTCRPVLLTSEGCLASQDPGIMGWMGWLSNSLGAEGGDKWET